jgi:hypothetical protein
MIHDGIAFEARGRSQVDVGVGGKCGARTGVGGLELEYQLEYQQEYQLGVKDGVGVALW